MEYMTAFQQSDASLTGVDITTHTEARGP